MKPNPLDAEKEWQAAARKRGFKSSDATTSQNPLGYWVVGPIDPETGDVTGVYDSWEQACRENGIKPESVLDQLAPRVGE